LSNASSLGWISTHSCKESECRLRQKKSRRNFSEGKKTCGKFSLSNTRRKGGKKGHPTIPIKRGKKINRNKKKKEERHAPFFPPAYRGVKGKCWEEKEQGMIMVGPEQEKAPISEEKTRPREMILSGRVKGNMGSIRTMHPQLTQRKRHGSFSREKNLGNRKKLNVGRL